MESTYSLGSHFTQGGAIQHYRVEWKGGSLIPMTPDPEPPSHGTEKEMEEELETLKQALDEAKEKNAALVVSQARPNQPQRGSLLVSALGLVGSGLRD